VPHFLANLTSAAMHGRLAQRCTEDPAHRVLHYLLGPERVLEWAHSVGVATDPSLAACVLPIPPLALRAITAEIEPPMFLYTGFLDLMHLVALYDQHAASRPGRPRVLDFGCGCGRLTRFLDPVRWDAHASEVNPDHVEWCRANMPDVDIRLNGYAPPLAFGDGYFDFVFSLSIFSHLSEKMLGVWLRELARVSKPGGVVMVTFHGAHALRVTAKSADHQAMLQLSAKDAHDVLDRLPRQHVVLLPYGEELIRGAKVGTPDYGTTFIDPPFALEMGKEHGFEPLALVSGGIRGFQDTLVLRRVV
jgi:SAM-dependent methyltransferase